MFGSPSYWVKGTYIGWILGTALWAEQSTSHLSYSLIYSSVFLEIRSQYIAQARPELMILLPQILKCWDCRHVLTSLVSSSFKFPAQI